MLYSPIKITFLGTGTSSGVPMIGCNCRVCSSSDKKDKRFRSSILVQTNKTSIVIDVGPDFRQQMLAHNIKKLDAVFLTHPHKDHIAGLDDIRAFNFFQKRPMDLYASAATLNRVKMEFDYAFVEKKMPGIPIINLHSISEQEKLLVGDLHIQPILVWHMKMPVLGFRFGHFTYITDANDIPVFSKQKIKGSRVLVINTLRKEPHVSHFTLDEGISLAQELAIPEVYFTHISHQMGKHQEVNITLPENRQLAYDGLVISL